MTVIIDGVVCKKIYNAQADRTYFRMQQVDAQTSCAALIEQARRPDSWLRHTDHLMDVPDP